MSIAAVQSRIADLQARFGAPVQYAPPVARSAATSAPATAAPAATNGQGFAALLDAVSGEQYEMRSAAPATAPASSPRPAPATGSGDAGERVVAAAKQYLGVPYRWGGTDPDTGLDCSGLVQRAFADIGVDVPRVSRDQARAGRPVASLAEARPGDLIAFGTPVDHIGIYAGGGKMVVAPKAGDVVKLQDVYRTPSAIRRVLPDTAAAPATAAPRSGGSTDAGPVSGAPAAGRAGAVPYAGLFEAAGARHGVDPRLLVAVARAESAFNPAARSPAGAQGLMQLMPGTARELGVDPLDPAAAVDGAARLLKRHLADFGSPELALAAYNAGPGAVRKHGGIPPYAETQNYVRKIMTEMRGAA